MSTGTTFFTQKHKNILYLSHLKRGTFGGLAGMALSRGRGIPGHWKKKHSFTHSFFLAAQLFPLRVGCLVGWRVGCCVVVMLLPLSLFTLLPRCQHRLCCHCWHAAAAAPTIGRHGGWRYLIVSHWIERQTKSGTKIHHGLRWLQNTNKNATTNQKHAGLMGKRWDMRHKERGAGGERDLLVFGQSSWDIV